MPTLWQTIDAKAGPLSPSARKFLELRGINEQLWQQVADRPKVIREVVKMVDHLRQCGYESSETVADAEPEAKPGIRDPRWSLWQGLREAAGQAEGWQPIVLRRVFDTSTSNGLSSDRVEVSFDCRLSQAAVLSSLRKLWPKLAKTGWVRPTKAMESRAAALVRFVCLESKPDTTWRTLCERWNEKVGADHPDWLHKDVRDFQSRFQRAEKQLTGHERGLEWFYDTDARPENWLSASGGINLGEWWRRESRGEKIPGIVGRHIVRKLRPGIYALNVRLARFAGTASALQGEGFTSSQIHERMSRDSADWRAFSEDASPEEAAAWIEAKLLAADANWPDFNLGTSKTE